MPIQIPSVNIGAIAPEIILVIVGCAVLLLDVFSKRRGHDLIAYLALAGVVLAALTAACPASTSGASEAFAGLYAVDRYTQFFKLIFLFGTGLTILISVRYAEEHHMNQGEYYALLLFATVGMMFLAGGADMITIFMGLELLSISLYILAGYTKTRLESNEASMKYFLLGAFASGFLLYGMALIYGITGETRLVEISHAIAANPTNITVLTIAVGLLMVGLAFKIGAVPFHQWTPDVYQGAPIPVTAFMSAGPKAAAMAAMIRIFVEAFNFLQVDWIMWLSVLAIMTMTIGNLAALVQSDVKRLLAFSSIAHAGYALVGITAANSGGASAVMYYMLVYTFMNIGAFGVLALVARKNEQDTSLAGLAGLGFRNPVLAAAMSILIFSLAGIPPMAGFMAKFYVFMSAVNAGHVGLVLVAVLNSAIGVYYYIKLVVQMYMKDPAPEMADLPPLKTPPALTVALLISVVGTLVLGLAPAKYLALAGKAFLPF